MHESAVQNKFALITWQIHKTCIYAPFVQRLVQRFYIPLMAVRFCHGVPLLCRQRAFCIFFSVIKKNIHHCYLAQLVVAGDC